MLGEARDALLTAFLVGDLLVVLPALVEACSALIRRHVDPSPQVAELPGSIVPTTFTFPHAGKLLSITFILFAGWFSDSEVPVARYPQLAASGFFSLFGSLNAAVPFLLDLFRIPADTFQLFLATGVVNSRFGTLVAGVHTVAVGLLGSAAIAGRLDFNLARLLRFFVSTAVLTAAIVLGLRAGFATFLDAATDGRDVVNALQPIASAPVDDSQVRAPADLPDTALPAPGGVLAAIYQRQTLRVGGRRHDALCLPQRSRPAGRLRRRDGAAARRRSRCRCRVRPRRPGRRRGRDAAPHGGHRDERRAAHARAGGQARVLRALPGRDAGRGRARSRARPVPVLGGHPRDRVRSRSASRTCPTTSPSFAACCLPPNCASSPRPAKCSRWTTASTSTSCRPNVRSVLTMLNPQYRSRRAPGGAGEDAAGLSAGRRRSRRGDAT